MRSLAEQFELPFHSRAFPVEAQQEWPPQTGVQVSAPRAPHSLLLLASLGSVRLTDPPLTH